MFINSIGTAVYAFKNRLDHGDLFKQGCYFSMHKMWKTVITRGQTNVHLVPKAIHYSGGPGNEETMPGTSRHVPVTKCVLTGSGLLLIGAFLIPYVVMLIFEGIPIFYLELSLGQRMRQGSISVWSTVSPYLGGVGIASTVICILVGSYYNVVISWVLFYFFNSFKSPLPWADCPTVRLTFNLVPRPLDVLRACPTMISSGMRVRHPRLWVRDWLTLFNIVWVWFSRGVLVIRSGALRIVNWIAWLFIRLWLELRPLYSRSQYNQKLRRFLRLTNCTSSTSRKKHNFLSVLT